jgi:hypothetical protein
MSARLIVVVAVVCAALLAGCATNRPKYDWGKYDPSLYAYYKDPTKVGQLTDSLAAIIQAAQVNHATVPPGVFAEYGYLQLQQGKSSAAIDLFRLEETHWPESKVFMDRMIKVASVPTRTSSTQGASP